MIIDKKEYDELIEVKKELSSLQWKNDRDDKEIKRLKAELADAKKSYFELKESGFNLEVTSERQDSTYSGRNFSIKKANVYIASSDLGKNLKKRLTKIIRSVINFNIEAEEAEFNRRLRQELRNTKNFLLKEIQEYDFALFANNRKHMNDLIKKRFRDL